MARPRRVVFPPVAPRRVAPWQEQGAQQEENDSDAHTFTPPHTAQTALQRGQQNGDGRGQQKAPIAFVTLADDFMYGYIRTHRD